MSIVLYAIAKFIGYSIWGYVGFRVAGEAAQTKQALSFGAARWMIGLVIGAVLFFWVYTTRENAHQL